MANQDAAFGLRPLKTVGQQDDSTGMSQYNIVPGDASVIFQGTVVKAVAGGYADLAADGDGANLGAFWDVSMMTQQHKNLRSKTSILVELLQ